MKRILVYARLNDGLRHLLFHVAPDFDLRAWAESRRSAFKLLQIVGLETEEISLEN